MKGTKTGNARYYAHALFELAMENHQEDKILEEMELLARLLKETPHFREFLTLSLLPEKDKIALLDRVLQSSFSEITLNFIKILVEKQQFESFEKIFQLYRHLCDERGETIRVTATTVVPLNEKQTSHLKTLLSKHFKREAIIHNKIDPEVLGGLLIQAGDLFLDTSLKGKMDSLHKKLAADAKKILQIITVKEDKK